MYYDFKKGEIVEDKASNINPALKAEIDKGVSLLTAELIMKRVFGKEWKEITGITRTIKD